MEYQVRHTTRYSYEHPVGSSYQSLHLTPRSFARQNVHHASITVSPEPLNQDARTDFFGNPVTDLFIRDPHDTLTIVAESRVVVTANEDVLLDLSPSWERTVGIAREAATDDARDAGRFCFPSPHVVFDGAKDYIQPLLTPGKPLLRLATNPRTSTRTSRAVAQPKQRIV